MADNLGLLVALVLRREVVVAVTMRWKLLAAFSLTSLRDPHVQYSDPHSAYSDARAQYVN